MAQAPLLAGTEDVGGPVNDAVVDVEGCGTGTLITSRIVLTSGHGVPNRTKPDGVEAYPHSCSDWENPGQWYAFNPPRTFSVNFGRDSRGWIATYRADSYSLPGCADIIMLRLTAGVPTSIARPAAVLTEPRPESFWSGRDLQMVGWGSSGLEDLWMRPAEPRDIDWRLIGHANLATGLAHLDGNVFGATEGNTLWMRPADSSNLEWTRIGHANDVAAMTALNGLLFAASKDDKLWVRDPVPFEVDWRYIGHANNCVAMAALDGKLFAVSRDHKLWARDPVLRDVPWQHIGHANNVMAMAGANGKLYAATSHDPASSDGRLWVRDPVLRDVPWQHIGHANNVRAMTGTATHLFASSRPKPREYPVNRYPIRQTGRARMGSLPGGGDVHFVAEGVGARIRPGDSGGPLFWLRPGEPRVQIGVVRQVNTVGGRYVATFFSTGSDRLETKNIGTWIRRMANPTSP